MGNTYSRIQELLHQKADYQARLNPDFARANMKANIYDQAVLEGVATTYPTDYHILCHIAKLVNEGFYTDGGRIRGVPAVIGGTGYVPPCPSKPLSKRTSMLFLPTAPIRWIPSSGCACTATVLEDFVNTLWRVITALDFYKFKLEFIRHPVGNAVLSVPTAKRHICTAKDRNHKNFGASNPKILPER